MKRRTLPPQSFRGNECYGEYRQWLRENGTDNHEQLERLKHHLAVARSEDLTAHQRHVMDLYYDQHLTVMEIAAMLGKNKSSVSRTLHRGRERLRRYLKYAF